MIKFLYWVNICFAILIIGLGGWGIFFNGLNFDSNSVAFGMSLIISLWILLRAGIDARASMRLKQKPWRHHKNTRYIDQVMEHSAKYPSHWFVVPDVPMWADAWETLLSNPTWQATANIHLGTERNIIFASIYALIVMENAGLMFELNINDVKALADVGNHTAIIILQARLALDKSTA